MHLKLYFLYLKCRQCSIISVISVSSKSTSTSKLKIINVIGRFFEQPSSYLDRTMICGIPLYQYLCWQILDALADTLTFGALERCPQCNSQLFLNNSSFQCKGYLSEWVQCDFASATPNRKPAIVPLKIRRKHKFLRREYPPKNRQFYNVKPIMSIEPAEKAIKQEEGVKNEPNWANKTSSRTRRYATSAILSSGQWSFTSKWHWHVFWGGQ